MAGKDNETGPESMTRGPKIPQATPGEEDVEGHRDGGDTGPESIARGGNFPRATGDEDEAPGPDGLK